MQEQGFDIDAEQVSPNDSAYKPARTKQVLKFILFLAIGIGLPLLIAKTPSAVTPDKYATQQDYLNAYNQAVSNARNGMIIVPFIYFALLCRKAGHRWFHAFAIYIPVYNLVWATEVCWRRSWFPKQYWLNRKIETG